MNRPIFEIQADFCKAMGNATRLQMIHILRERPLRVREIAQLTGLGQSFISRQLSRLRNMGVVKFQRQGNETLYQLTDPTLGEVCDLVRKVLPRRRIGKLKRFRQRILEQSFALPSCGRYKATRSIYDR